MSDQDRPPMCGAKPAYQPSAPGCWLNAGHDGEHRNWQGLVFGDEPPMPARLTDRALGLADRAVERAEALSSEVRNLRAALDRMAEQRDQARADLESATHERDEARDQLAATRSVLAGTTRWTEVDWTDRTEEPVVAVLCGEDLDLVPAGHVECQLTDGHAGGHTGPVTW